jgi:hypothetical protein
MNGASSASAGMTASFEGRRYTEPFHPSRRFLAFRGGPVVPSRPPSGAAVPASPPPRPRPRRRGWAVAREQPPPAPRPPGRGPATRRPRPGTGSGSAPPRTRARGSRTRAPGTRPSGRSGWRPRSAPRPWPTAWPPRSAEGRRWRNPPTTKALLVRRTGPAGDDLREANLHGAPPGRHTAGGIAPGTEPGAQQASPKRPSWRGHLPPSGRPYEATSVKRMLER